ncbi:hypothetical protein GCM10027063_23040 [Promicromonospora xylanilytica]
MPAQDPTDLDAAVDALYTRALDEFVAARDAAVRQATDSGDRVGAERVKRLPKPSVAAWVVNQVARDHPEEIAALADLGDELRSATQDRDRGRLRALDHLRRERTDALVRTVREAGEVRGRAVSSAVLDRLTETLTAAVMDPDAATAVRAGRLSRALQHVGFGIVDEQGEEADLVTLHPVEADEPADDRATADEDAELAAAEQAVEETSARVDELESRRDAVRERLRAAAEAIESGQGDVEHLDQEIERITAQRDEARQALDDARESADEARADLTAVEDELDDAVERAAEARRRRRAARGR